MNKSLSRRAFLRTSIASGASLAAAAAGAAPAGIYRPGTYSAKASGIGEVTVTMTFDADRIIDVVLDVSHETPGIGQAAADTLKKNLMAAQAAEIDGVSGATITSKAVSKAAAKCIAQAKGEIPVEVISDTKTDEDDGDWLGKEPEIAERDIVATHETDILVVGCGTGGLFGVLASIQASELDSALVCFGSGVCIERLPRLGACRIPTIEQPGDFTGKLATALDVVVIAHVDQALGLVLQSLGDDWMAMTETAHADARDEVEICIALGIFDFHALAGNELDGLTSKRMHHILRFKFLLLL